MTQYFIFSFMLYWVLFERTGHTKLMVLSGVSLGLSFLTHPANLIYILPLCIAISFQQPTAGSRQFTGYYTVIFMFVVAAAIAHYMNPLYMWGVFVHRTGLGSILSPAEFYYLCYGLAVALALYPLLLRLPPLQRVGVFLRSKGLAIGTVAGVLVILLIGGRWLLTTLDILPAGNKPNTNLHILSCYLPWGLWPVVAYGGYRIIKTGKTQVESFLMMAVVLFFYLVFFQRFWTEYQFYWARYVFREGYPFAVILLAYGLHTVWQKRIRWLKIAVAAVAVLLVGYGAYFNRYTFKQPVREGAYALMERLNALLEERSIVLVSRGRRSGAQYARLSIPLACMYGHDVAAAPLGVLGHKLGLRLAELGAYGRPIHLIWLGSRPLPAAFERLWEYRGHVRHEFRQPEGAMGIPRRYVQLRMDTHVYRLRQSIVDWMGRSRSF